MKEYSPTVLSEGAIPTIFISKPNSGVKRAYHWTNEKPAA